MATLNELLHAASRTFAIGIDLLPEPLRSEVEVAYLLLRISDYLEDNTTMEPALKAALLRRWASVLEGEEGLEALAGEIRSEVERSRDDGPDALVATSVVQVTAAYRGLEERSREVVGRHVRDSTLGMARWAERGPDIEDEAALDDYMHEVAGRVGWLLTELFAPRVPRFVSERDAMMGVAKEFGLALQTVNVIRGLHADWERGWVYVPRSFVGDGAEAPHELFRPGGRDAAVEARVLARLVTKAERHLRAAERYILAIPRRQHGMRLFCLLPYLFAVRTLAVSRDNPRVFDEETKITRSEVRRIVRDCRLWAWSNWWVRRYGRRLAGV